MAIAETAACAGVTIVELQEPTAFSIIAEHERFGLDEAQATLGLGWDDALENWLFAFLGNLVGAGIFVATTYWYLYVKDAPQENAGAGGVTERTAGVGDRRSAA